MGSLSPGPDHAVRTAAVIGTEEEAVTVAGTLAALFDDAAPDGGAGEARLALLSRSGLFGISVPTEYGGIDVPNAILAEVCATAAAQSAMLGDILAAHFVALETLRSHGTESQRAVVFPAVLAGARLARASVLRPEGEDALRLAASGFGWRMGGEALCTPCMRDADWVLVPVRAEAARASGLLLPARADGLHYVANGGDPAAAEHVLFKDVAVENDALTAAANGRDVPRALDLLLAAAGRLGAGRRRLRRLLEETDADATALGLASARLSAAAATVAEAGRAVDAAQLGLAEHHRTHAFHAAVAALLAARESAGETDAPAALLGESGALLGEAHRRGPEPG